MTVIGPYRLLRTLGACEEGKVWSAFAADGTSVTIAVLDGSRAGSEAWLRDFGSRADALSVSGQVAVVSQDLAAATPWIACAWDGDVGAARLFTAYGLNYRPAFPQPIRARSIHSDRVVAHPALAEPTVPERVVAERVVPEHVTEAVVAEPAVPEPAVPEPVVAESAAPEPVVPESVVPESVVPESVVPESVVPEAVVPEAVVPESVVPESVVPEAHLEPAAEPAWRVPAQYQPAPGTALHEPAAPEPEPPQPQPFPQQSPSPAVPDELRPLQAATAELPIMAAPPPAQEIAPSPPGWAPATDVRPVEPEPPAPEPIPVEQSEFESSTAWQRIEEPIVAPAYQSSAAGPRGRRRRRRRGRAFLVVLLLLALLGAAAGVYVAKFGPIGGAPQAPATPGSER